MGIVLESLLCALVASLCVTSWLLGPLIIDLREYLKERTNFIRSMKGNNK